MLRKKVIKHEIRVSRGKKAPDFSLPDENGNKVSLSEFLGKNVVLFFYPKDDTPGCTLEARDFTALKDEFTGHNAVILGISKDDSKVHRKFCDKHNLQVTLLSDEVSDVCNEYGVWRQKTMFGKKYMGIERTTFLINENGEVADLWQNVSVVGHAKQVLESLKGM